MCPARTELARAAPGAAQRATSPEAARRPAVFLDRDGVLNELVPDPSTGLPESPLRSADVRLLPGAAAGAAELQSLGFALVVVTNQPAWAKGKASREALLAVHQQVVDLLAAEGVALDGWRWCLHHPEALVDELRGDCRCRKPRPGMLLDAAAELSLDLERSWIIGDSDADVAAGREARCGTILVANPSSAHRRSGSPTPDAAVQSLPEAAAYLRQRAHRW
ncbi:MAG TPA: HAD family hydrolase [Acidimicrobiales bacterium]|nr:HAD family hydrolase [Acidimicrobiales bacterium]